MTDTPTTEEEAPAEAAPVESDPVREAIVEQLAAQFKDAIVDTHIAKGDLWVRVANEQWHDVIAFCKTTLNFRWFDFLSGVDWLINTDLSAEKRWDFGAEKAVPTVDVTSYAGGDTRFQVMCRLKNID
ncbi:MAG TPA: hypothetical protein VMZ33_07470, partial [Candidatus Limnocylindrales bacterium]|nr:hypothetical protein [Candidatus Limnocylindrales bacterium]